MFVVCKQTASGNISIVTGVVYWFEDGGWIILIQDRGDNKRHIEYLGVTKNS